MRKHALTASAALFAAMSLHGVPAAQGGLGLLDHYELCTPKLTSNDYHDYVDFRSIAVDPGGTIYTGARDGIIRVLSSGGHLLSTLDSGPHGDWIEPTVANGAAGVAYIGDESDQPQLARYDLVGATLELSKTYSTTEGAYTTTAGMRDLVGIAATENRGLFVLDPTQGIVNLNDSEGTFISLTFPGGNGRLVAITAIPNGIVTAGTSDNPETPDWLAFYAGNPLSYIGQVTVSSSIDGIADARDGTVWVLSSHGLERYRFGTLVESVPGLTGDALDTGSDGSVWLVRSDGILHLGPGGGPIPPDVYGHVPCGGPQISDSLPPVHIASSHSLELSVKCNEACAVEAAGTLTVPGSHVRFELSAAPRSVGAGGRALLVMHLSHAALKALAHAVAHHHKATVQLDIEAADAGGVRNYFEQRLLIS